MFQALVKSFLVLIFVALTSTAPTGISDGDQCPTDWKYFSQTDKCFQVFGTQSDGVSLMNWVAAEDHCEQFSGGHLASFHTPEEVAFVVDMAHKAEAHGDRMYIGLSFNSLANWSWQDGSTVTYFKWWNGAEAQKNSEKNPAGLIFTRQMHTGYMGVTDGKILHSFVCQASTTVGITTMGPEEGT